MKTLPIKALQEVLKALVEVSVDTGVADDTSLVTRLDDSAKAWPVNAFTDLIVEITAGTGEGQVRKIDSNTATSLVPVTNFATAPDATSQYRIGFYGKMTSDIASWGGTGLTGRDISLDFKSLTDDSLKGLLKSIGDVAALENLITRIGQTSDAMVAAGAVGSLSAKLRRLTQDLSTRATEATLAKVIPVAKADLFNTALPAAEANWLGSDITPTNSPSYLRIYVCVSVTGILRVARTISATTLTEDLNSGTALVAGAAYLFTVPWRSGDGIDIRYSVTTGTINRLLIDEIGGAE